MIWDCVLYNGERDVLGIRMGELAPLGVHHLIVEGKRTFQGENKDVEPIVGPNLTHIIVDFEDDCPCGCGQAIRFSPNDAWVREAHQRNAVMPHLAAADPQDLVLLGDVDEIPRAVDISIIRPDAMPIRFLMDAYVFCLDWYGGRDVPGTVVLRAEQITSPALIRHADMQAIRGGWHLTYMGGKEAIERKLRSFSHAELNIPGVRDELEDAIHFGVVPWNGVRLTPMDDTSHLPKYVQENIDKFSHLLRPTLGV